MYIVDPKAGTCTPANMSLPKDECPLKEALCRLAEECEDWKEYSSKDGERYAIPAQQEFQHMLLALDDFIHVVHEKANPAELEELKRLTSTLGTV